MTWLIRQIKLVIMLIILTSCATTGDIIDGETLIMAIPKGCEKQYVEFYKCEFSKTILDKLFMKECKMEKCENNN